MAAIQMQTNMASPSGVTLPAPSGVNYVITNGIASVNPEDVDLAVRMLNWSVLPGQNWPAGRVVRMTIPAQGAWPTSGTLPLPDGTTASVTAGVAKIPQAWVTWAVGLGFTQ